MPRYFLSLEYDGTGYVGWQRQTNGPSIQQTLEEAVAAMLGEQVSAIACGRTDAGVHAFAMPVHIDLVRSIEPERLQGGLNHYLREAHIAVLDASVAPANFHARFSASARAYQYRIRNRRAPPTLDRHRVWHVAIPLNHEAMHEAAQALAGKHDFTSFRASECQAQSPVKTLTQIEVHRTSDIITIDAEAPSFLHHQIRNIVGSLKLVGSGARPVSFIATALAARDRRAAGPTAPPTGLHFVRAAFGEARIARQV